MGTAATTTGAVIAALVAARRPATADPSCTGITAGGERYPICFDVGNRISITAGSAGFGAGASIRHVIDFADDPGVVWKLEHQLFEASYAGFEDRFSGVAYAGRFLRHARDGHLVLPFGIPRTLFLPFDVGVEAEVGRLAWRPADPIAIAGIIKTAALIDVSRSERFRWRLAIGPLARWDIAVDRFATAIDHHVVAPFSTGVADARFESHGGIVVAGVRVEAGTAWHTAGGWQPEVVAQARLERIVIAVNDRPIALILGGGYASATAELSAQVGARVVVLQRRDPRVSTTSPFR